MHTHLDAQIGWDPDMTPVSWHGVFLTLMEKTVELRSLLSGTESFSPP